MDEITITIPVFYVHVGFWLFIVWCALGIAQSVLDMLRMYYQRKLERAKEVSDEFAQALMDDGLVTGAKHTNPKGAAGGQGGAAQGYPPHLIHWGSAGGGGWRMFSDPRKRK